MNISLQSANTRYQQQRYIDLQQSIIIQTILSTALYDDIRVLSRLFIHF